MLEQIKQRLGANYIEDTDNVIKDIIDDMTSIACAASNRKEDDKKLFPYIKKLLYPNIYAEEQKAFYQEMKEVFLQHLMI